ncbi:MAG: hypothetical protein COV67_01415 [Nitrospinae bacterium CG11_big_fil_rev_8_21_14_0_20_56_8]|nr:MAG: hypothetical protein COV67_01415 [Nitrospinae bacterium CG11_big_fil_rev_8_21_14_0_20_56_8]
MCGRYSLAKPGRAIEQHFPPLKMGASHPARYNIAPTQPAPVIVHREGERIFQIMRWGLVPSWAQDKKMASRLINARAETLSEKPSFKNSFKTRRCLVPADGFFEWKTDGKSKRPHYIFLKSKDLFAMAGIWSQWDREETPLLTYSIITTPANSRLAPLHPRMPVILAPENYGAWLDPATEAIHLQSLLAPYPSDFMDHYEISGLVNSPAHDAPEILAPLG